MERFRCSRATWSRFHGEFTRLNAVFILPVCAFYYHCLSYFVCFVVVIVYISATRAIYMELTKNQISCIGYNHVYKFPRVYSSIFFCLRITETPPSNRDVTSASGQN